MGIAAYAFTLFWTTFVETAVYNPEISGSQSRDGAKISREKSGPARFHPTKLRLDLAVPLGLRGLSLSDY